MGLNWRAGAEAALGAGAGLMADSIKRDRDLADADQRARTAASLAEELDAKKKARIAAVLQGAEGDALAANVKKTYGDLRPVSDLTDEELQRHAPTERDTLSAQITRLEAAGHTEEADRRRGLMEKIDTREATAKHREEEIAWRNKQADNQMEHWREQTAISRQHNAEVLARMGPKLSPAAKAALDLASVTVGSAQQAEKLAVNELVALAKDPMANEKGPNGEPSKLEQARSTVKLAQDNVKSAIEFSNQTGKAYFGDDWKDVPLPGATKDAVVKKTGFAWNDKTGEIVDMATGLPTGQKAKSAAEAKVLISTPAKKSTTEPEGDWSESKKEKSHKYGVGSNFRVSYLQSLKKRSSAEEKELQELLATKDTAWYKGKATAEDSAVE